MKYNIAREKSLLFSINISQYYLSLKKKKYYEIAGQLFRSGTSIGANICESVGAQSRKDFLHKLEMAIKEAYETDYWLEILEKGFEENVIEFKKCLQEIIKLLAASIKTLKSS